MYSEMCDWFSEPIQHIRVSSNGNPPHLKHPVCTDITPQVSYGANGNTLKEMLEVMKTCPQDSCEAVVKSEWATHIKALNDSIMITKGVDLLTANLLIIKEGFPVVETFKTTVTKTFNAEIVNTGSPKEMQFAVNKAVSKHTNNKIEEMPLQIDDLTRLILLNCVYFKGLFTNPFDRSISRPGKFRGSTKEEDCTFMHKKEKMNFKEDGTSQVVFLPYGPLPSNGDTTATPSSVYFVVILPKKEGEAALLEEAASLRGNFEKLACPPGQTDGILTMPRMKVKWEKNMNDILQKLGMKEAFSMCCNLTGIGENLFISQVMHTAVLDVNEEGTEACAATAAVIKLRSLPKMAFTMKVDRPFLLAIVHSTGTPLFVGAVTSLAD
eukprot:GHVR01174144.1.p1 GENE.GHVR01174144.1~~GHVR01174144.1.p1  ORF type:complete len:381 (-),score=79.76 GHVR01174144.1:223-1365(-)